ncbi:DUF2490 domain-containing protein [Fibrella forsythiae]|uniref:DUF2490 domain-containing protein n=1 Tax=Fibrella forsythiae TaxID=2817061 RepID=A0ABS3JAY5_9BACT|nr:DUF2490 domain-containing protein [Fibrella forsythiae]MBO0947150.1 DUF2490 domain-containing protein [Fibrella forsythiae]
MTSERIGIGQLWLLILLWLSGGVVAAQSRVLDHNAIGWYTYNGDHKISKNWAIHTEYQWRRIELIRTWQQSLARLGLVRSLSDRVKAGVGYTYFTTFPYGKYPQADAGVPYSEHRIHEDIQFKSSYGTLDLTQRFRLEQRWLATLSEQNPRQVADWEFQNRIRYQIAGELPLSGPTIDDGEFYLNFFDEVFIGFGQNVGQNIFNQNRLSGGLGYQFGDNLQIELNYLNQVVQHADLDQTTGKPVFEINNGFRLNLVYNIDFTKE